MAFLLNRSRRFSKLAVAGSGSASGPSSRRRHSFGQENNSRYFRTVEAYEARSLRFIELLRIDDWRMKLYGIAWRRELPRSKLLEAAKRISAEQLCDVAPSNYKVGFVGVRVGSTFASFERNAWIKHVLCKSSMPDFRAYLDERLNEDA
jgi:hypothetical protein